MVSQRLSPTFSWLRLGALLLALTVALLAGHPAHARNMEPGRLFYGVGLGLGARLPTAMLASPAAGVVAATGEYTLHKAVSLLAGADLALGPTALYTGALGVRGRVTDFGLAISPYGQVQFSAGALVNVLGATVPWVGTRLGLGTDYFLTGNTTAGLKVDAALGSSVSERAAFYGTIQVILYANYGRPLPKRPTPEPLPVWGA
jgi:hypothetical protein